MVPGFTSQEYRELVQYLLDRNHGKGSSAKQQRQHLRRVLVGIIGVNIGQQLKMREDIKSLEPLIISRPARPNTDVTQDAGEVGLDSLFGED